MNNQRKDYEGHKIELRKSKGDLQLLIDGHPQRIGRLEDGKYFLDEYAYDWSEDLLELAQRFIDHKRVADEIRRKAAASSPYSEQGG